MPAEPSNRDLLARWRDGDHRAAQVLVDRYLARLTALARSRLSRKLARRLDAEDVVLSAWRSFFIATERGRITVPDDDNLWPLLVTLTLRKLRRQSAKHHSERRDIDREQSFGSESGWPFAIANDPSPDEAAALTDELEYLLALLAPQDRAIASRRLRGDEPMRIAAETGCSERTIRRAMQRFRKLAEARDAEPGEVAARRSASQHTGCSAGAGFRRAEWLSADAFAGLQPTISFDDVLLQRIVGQGGVGKVYRALDRRRDVLVAVKFLRKSFWTDHRAVESLLRETHLVSTLSHASIIRHYGWGRTAAGAVFVVMDWLDGGDLSDVIRRGTVPLADVLRYGLTVAEGVDAAHTAGVVHGDLTPSNVLLGSDGRIVLTDFGFATSRSFPDDVPRGGTPGYLAPEQVSDAFGKIDQRTDVYGLGGLLYALLAGQPPVLGADVPEILMHVLSSRPPSALRLFREQIPAGLERLILDCLQKEPADRPSSLRTVIRRLAEINRNV